MVQDSFFLSKATARRHSIALISPNMSVSKSVYVCVCLCLSVFILINEISIINHHIYLILRELKHIE